MFQASDGGGGGGSGAAHPQVAAHQALDFASSGGGSGAASSGAASSAPSSSAASSGAGGALMLQPQPPASAAAPVPEGGGAPVSHHTVVLEVQELCEPYEGGVVAFRTQGASLAAKLSDESLRFLGAKDVDQARNPKAHPDWERAFIDKLKSCVAGDGDSAFPTLEVKFNKNAVRRGKDEEQQRFSGYYVDGIRLRP